MLQYKRRNNKDVSIELQESNFSPLLTYCNWSYAPEYHINLTTLQNILSSFNKDYIPYYLRIFNETPTQVIKAFLEEYGISKSSLESISNNLLDSGFKVKNVNL